MHRSWRIWYSSRIWKQKKFGELEKTPRTSTLHLDPEHHWWSLTIWYGAARSKGCSPESNVLEDACQAWRYAPVVVHATTTTTTTRDSRLSWPRMVLYKLHILLVNQHWFFSNLRLWTNFAEWLKFYAHKTHAAFTWTLPEPRQWLWQFACQFLVRSFFGMGEKWRGRHVVSVCYYLAFGGG